MRVGQHVAAKRDIGTALSPVRKGDVGVIVEAGYFGGYVVDFGNGQVLRNVTGDSVRPVSAAGPLGTGCLCLAAVVTTVGAAAYRRGGRRHR